MYQPTLPNLTQHSRPTLKTDWSAYLSWIENDLSYRERTEDNVLLINGFAHVIATDTAAACISHAHFDGQAQCAVLLFYDLPVAKAGAVVGSEVHVLGYDLLEGEFVVVWFEECPRGLGELAVGWREKWLEMCRFKFQDIVRVLDDPKLAEDVSPAWEEEFGSEVFSEWKEELGLKVCALLLITQFVLDFRGAFDLELYKVWYLQALLTAWRRKVGRWSFAAKKAAALDLSDPGMSSGSSASLVDESFGEPEGSPGSVTFSFGNPGSKKELLASLESYTMTPSRGNTYKRRPEQCIYDEEDEEGWGALQNWAASQQDSAVELAGSKPAKGPPTSVYESSRYATSSDEAISPTTTFTTPPENVPLRIPLLQLDDRCPSDATENSECSNLDTFYKISLERSSVIAMADALKELVEKRPALDSAKNQKKLKELLAELVHEAEANPLEVQCEDTEPIETRQTDGEGDGEDPSALEIVQHSRVTEKEDGVIGKEREEDEGYGEGKSVRFIEGPHPTVVIPEEEVSVVG